MTFTYVIEHMEEDDNTPKSIPEWVELEYRHMRTLAGPSSTVHFTHLSHASSSSLSTVLSENDTDLAKASVHEAGVLNLMECFSVPLQRVCLLDPKAEKELSPDDGDGAFDWFLFGGILGDDPPRDRTSELRKLGFPTRHLGPVQMTTDTALGVTKKVVQDKFELGSIQYIDFPTIIFNSRESVEMPFRYISVDGQPILPTGMRELMHKDLNRSFDF